MPALRGKRMVKSRHVDHVVKRCFHATTMARVREIGLDEDTIRNAPAYREDRAPAR
ncbi:MAG: hypothetical protein K2X57_29210 [Xanthobacteraceae bacterium]|nr:hypothetical protein [Xanthobacteraceae bacterium]